MVTVSVIVLSLLATEGMSLEMLLHLGVIWIYVKFLFVHPMPVFTLFISCNSCIIYSWKSISFQTFEVSLMVL